MPVMKAGPGRALLGNSAVEATYADKVLGYNPSAYWVGGEATGTVAVCEVNAAQNGTYNSDVSGWPPGTGIGDGNTMPTFDGANDCINVHTVPFLAAFSGAAGTIALWAIVSGAGVWTDGSQDKLFYFGVDGNNYVYIEKNNANNRIQWLYRAGGVTEVINLDAVSTIALMHLAITWDKAADEVKAYYNGAQSGLTQNGLGVWAGALAATNAVLGAINITPVLEWNGRAGHFGVWDTALPLASIADLAVV